MNRNEEAMDMKMMGELRDICSCGICFRLFEEATSLTICFHMFCRKCVDEKIAQGDFKCCPVCHIDVGPDPAKKLRPAQGWEKVKDIIFREENEKMEQESTENLETESAEASSMDVKLLLPIKAEEDATVGSVATSSEVEKKEETQG